MSWCQGVDYTGLLVSTFFCGLPDRPLDRAFLPTWAVRSLGAGPMVPLSSWQPHHNKHSFLLQTPPWTESGLQPLVLPIRSLRGRNMGSLPLFHDLLETRGSSGKQSWFMSSWQAYWRCIWPFTIRPLSHGSSWITEISVYPERCPDIWGVLPRYRVLAVGLLPGTQEAVPGFVVHGYHASALL